jgi:PAS domain S-box-containing protein
VEDAASRVAALEARIQALEAERGARSTRLARLFEANPVPLFVVGPASRVVDANQGALHVLGRTRDTVLGRPFLELLDPAWRERGSHHLAQARAGRAVGELGLLTTDGKALFARLETVVVPDEGGNLLLLAVLVLDQDRDRARAMGDALQDARDRVRAFSDRYPRR